MTLSQDRGQMFREMKKQSLVMMHGHYDMVINMEEAQVWTFLLDSIQERWSLELWLVIDLSH